MWVTGWINIDLGFFWINKIVKGGDLGALGTVLVKVSAILTKDSLKTLEISDGSEVSTPFIFSIFFIQEEIQFLIEVID